MPSRNAEQEVSRLAAASLWQVRLSEAGIESCAEFEAWLASDPGNPRAWARVQAPRAVMDEHATGAEVMAARQGALGRARRAREQPWWRKHPKWRNASVAAALIAGSMAALLSFRGQPQELQFGTAIGQRRMVTLPDRSRVFLDAGTRLKVLYTRRARQIYLEQGQARFQDTHSRERPFIVHSAGEDIVAIGTDFNVDLLGSRTSVTLVSGRVSVAPALPGSAGSVVLRPGEQLVVSPPRPAHVKSVNVANVTAWEKGQLIFDDAPLGLVVATVSRYCDHPIRAARGAAGLRISGVFEEGDAATFLDVVTHYLPVRANRSADGTITLHRRP